MDQEADYENFEEEPNFEDYTDDQITELHLSKVHFQNTSISV